MGALTNAAPDLRGDRPLLMPQVCQPATTVDEKATTATRMLARVRIKGPLLSVIAVPAAQALAVRRPRAEPSQPAPTSNKVAIAQQTIEIKIHPCS